MFEDTSISAASSARGRDKGMMRYKESQKKSKFVKRLCKSMAKKKELKLKNKKEKKASNYQNSNLFLEKVQKSSFITSLLQEFPMVTPHKNWVFLPEVVIRENFIKSSTKILEDKAARSIQSYWRVFLTKRAFMVYKNKLRIVAKRFQRAFRRWKQKKKSEEEKNKAAIRIQSHWRGAVVRKQTVKWCYSKIDLQLSSFKQMREQHMKEEIKYYCNLWRTKIKNKKYERRMHARKAFVFYAITVFEKNRRKKPPRKSVVKMKTKKTKQRKSTIITNTPSAKNAKLPFGKNRFRSVVKTALKLKIKNRGGLKPNDPSPARESPLNKSKTLNKHFKGIDKLVPKKTGSISAKSSFSSKKENSKSSHKSGQTDSKIKKSKIINDIIYEEEESKLHLNSPRRNHGGLKSPEIRVIKSSSKDQKSSTSWSKKEKNNDSESMATTDENLDDLARKSE